MWSGNWMDERGIDRQEIVIASKVYWTQGPVPDENLTRKTSCEELNGSLEDLGTDHLDIYHIHPGDDDTPIRETLSTLNGLINKRKINYLAASSMAPWKLMKVR